MSAKASQKEIHELLKTIFGNDHACLEWDIRKGSTDTFSDPETYRPRLDIAIGPFNNTQDREEKISAINAASSHAVLDKIIKIATEQNYDVFVKNKNPRCLLAIEIEFSGSGKHILGDFTNASMIGLVGVITGPVNHITKIRRVAEYVRTLRRVEKAPDDLFTNVACLEVDYFIGMLKSHLPAP